MGTTHDAHEILSAFGSINKLRTLDEKLEVLHASLVLQHDESIRLITRPKPVQKYKRPDMVSEVKKIKPDVSHRYNADPPDCALPEVARDADRRVCAIYNSLPYERSHKVKKRRSRLGPLIAHERSSVDRFRHYSDHPPTLM